MSDVSWAMLRNLLVDRYDELRRRLARRLGSAEVATETLHETWLRLARSGSAGAVDNPESYVVRVALNVAFDRRHAEGRQLSASDIEALRHLDDNELDPHRITEARSEIRALKQALDELPPRCPFSLQRVSRRYRKSKLPSGSVYPRAGWNGNSSGHLTISSCD
jgi:DNA-directed RNA polymerase specialized sigma24 family protein